MLLMNEDLFVTTHDLGNINPDLAHVDYQQVIGFFSEILNHHCMILITDLPPTFFRERSALNMQMSLK